MPVWTEAELIALAEHLRDQRPKDTELQELYAEEAVKARFAKYGGIYRYVLPTDSAAILDNEKKFKASMSTVNHMVFSREGLRSEEHTSELQSLMRTSYAVFCL